MGTRIPKSAGAKPALSFHPVAEVFPLPDESHLQAMAEDIAANGLLDPIMLYEGKILDGRSRYLACQRVVVAPKFQDYAGSDPLGFVISRNVHRRHLTKNQRVFAAARAATLPVGSNQTTQSPGLPIGSAAKVFEVSARSIARTKAILRDGTPELVQAVESGQIAVSRAVGLCGLTEQAQLAKLREIVEQKRTPRKQTKKPAAATGDESTRGSQSGAVQQTQSTPNTEREFVIPTFPSRRLLPRDDAAAIY